MSDEMNGMDTELHKKQIIAAFKERGIDGAEIEFSGGNDDGGPDLRYFYRLNAEGERECVEVNDYHHISVFVDDEWQRRTLTSEQIADNDFLDLVDAPIDWRWEGFGGAFEVHGVLHYNINDLDKWCVLSFDESSYTHYEVVI